VRSVFKFNIHERQSLTQYEYTTRAGEYGQHVLAFTRGLGSGPGPGPGTY